MFDYVIFQHIMLNDEDSVYNRIVKYHYFVNKDYRINKLIHPLFIVGLIFTYYFAYYKLY